MLGRIRCVSMVLAAVAAAVPRLAQADSVIKADNAYPLNAPTSWSASAVPAGADFAVFDGTLGTFSAFTLGDNLQSWKGIVLLNPAHGITIGGGNFLSLGAGGVDMTGAVQPLTLNNSLLLAATQTFNTASPALLVSGSVNLDVNTLAIDGVGPVTFGGVIGGAGGLLKGGIGTLTLQGTNTYTGPTSIKSGFVQLNGTLGPGDVNVEQGGTLNLPGTNQTLVNLSGGGSVVGNLTKLHLMNSTLSIFDGVISGSAFVDKLGNGTLSLGGVNTYTGGTALFAGALIVRASNGLGSAGISLNRTGSIFYNVMMQLANGVSLSNDIVMKDNAVNPFLFAASMIDVGTQSTATLMGSISATGASNQFRLGTSGGTLVLTGKSTAGSAQAAVNNTTLWGNGQSPINGNFVFSGTASLTSWETPLSLRLANVWFKDSATYVAAGTSSGAGLVMGMPGGFSNYPGNNSLTIQDSAFINLGTRAIDLANLIGGPNVLNLNGGSMLLGKFDRTNRGPDVTVNFDGTQIIAGQSSSEFFSVSLSLNTKLNVQAGGAIFDTKGFAITASRPLLHSSNLGATPDGGLTKLGGGTLILTSSSSYTGPTSVIAGTLQIGAGGSTGSLGGGTVINNGTVAFNRTGTFALNNTIAGTGTLSQVGTGKTTLSAYQGTGPMSVAAGKLVFDATGATRQTPAVLIEASTLTLASTLDLTNRDLMLHSGSEASYEAQVAAAYDFGSWDLPGITSSTAGASSNFTSLGIMSGSDYNNLSPNTGTFDGMSVASTDTLIKYTYTGDINLDGLVNIDDLSQFLPAYQGDQTGNYAQGDLNFDGLVNIDDLSLLLSNYYLNPSPPLGSLETSQISPAPSVPAPEPATLLLLSAGTAILLARQTRSRRKIPH